MPRIAAAPPCPGGTACCIDCPRNCTKPTAVLKSTASAATSAEYSPRLCPAIAGGIAPPCLRQTRQVATPAVSMSGCVLSVSAMASSGPSWLSFHKSYPSTSDASANVSWMSGSAAASFASIPTDCEPWPGKTKAKVIVYVSPAGKKGARL